MRCHACKKGTLAPATVEESMKVAGHTFEARVPVLRCPSCDQWVYTSEALGRFELVVARTLAEAGEQSGDVFRFMRKALGLRAVDLAELLGVAPETVSRWETGARDIDRGALALLGALVVDRSEGRTRTVDRLQALAKPRTLGRTVRVDLGERAA